MKRVKILRDKKLKLRLNQDPDRTPPEQAAENARRGLECVEEVDTDAGEAKGRERARQIIDAVESGSELSPETIADIASFDRHRAQGNHTVDEEFEGEPCRDNGFVSWKLWGGSAGVDWAQRVNNTLSDNVRIQFNQTRYSEGDEVETPEGVGVVVEIRTEDFEGPDGAVEASEDSPAYVVGTMDGASVFRASDITLLEEGIETDVGNPEADLMEQSANITSNQETTFGIPDSWEESETPNRLILLKAWAGLGGRFTSCVREMRGELTGSPDRFCASMKDRVLQWEGWRR